MKIKNIEIGFNHIDKIVHISDIHIRNFKRQGEYRKVFRTLAKSIKDNKTKNTIIAITGDIVHSKNDITPELVQEVTYFLSLLASIAPTIVFPGNHDANLNNPNRLDTLTPIIRAMNNDRVVYIKDSGVYKIADLHISHWGVFDTRDKYIHADDFEAKNKIAVYHAPVNSATTESNFELLENIVSVSNFYGYNLVLLGDIHKFQYLNEDKTIAYPGSIIQQNHSEALEHGYLIWDIASRTSEFVIVPNEVAFYTINIENGIYDDIPENLPNKLYLRVRYKNTNQSTIKNVISEIKKNRDIIEVTYQKVNTFSSNNELIEKDSLITNVRDINFQNSLIKSYLKDNSDITEDDINKVCELNEIINRELTKSELARNIYWTPKSFTFSNMFSYGKDNHIDFTNLSGTYGVFGQNAHGKSSLFEAIVYCIFDKCAKTSKASQVMNNNYNDFQCKLDFELDGIIYTIERKAKRLKSDHVKLDVDFYCVDESGNKTILNGKDRYDTDQMIRNLLGTYEDFILTSMSLQDNNTGFITMGQTERKNLLAQFLDINIFDQLYNIVNEKVKESAILIKEYKKIDYDVEINICNENIEKNKRQYRLIQNKKSELQNTIQKHEKKISKLRESLVPMSEKITDISLLESKKSTLDKNEEEIKDQISKLKLDIQEQKRFLIEIDQKINLNDENDLINKVTILIDKNEKKNNIKVEIEKLKISMTNMLEKMQKLDCVEYDENCQFCMNNIFVKDAIKTKESIQCEEALIKEKISSLKNIEKEIEEYSVFDLEYKKLKHLQQEKNKLALHYHFLESQIEKKNSELHKIKAQIKETSELVKLFYKNKKTIEKNNVIKNDILLEENTLTNLKLELDILNEELIESISDTQFYEKKLEEYSNKKNRLYELEDGFKHLEYYMLCVNKDGIPYKLISSIIPRIESDVNNILNQIVDFQMAIKSDGKNINAYIVYDDSRLWPIELSSGMEKFISSIALRTALINISSLPRPNFLAIDEGFGALDQENRSNISVLMEYLKTQFKFIIMISHIDSIKDVVDKQIEIFKTKGAFSKVNYQ